MVKFYFFKEEFYFIFLSFWGESDNDSSIYICKFNVYLYVCMDSMAQNYGYNRLFYKLIRLFEILYHNFRLNLRKIQKQSASQNITKLNFFFKTPSPYQSLKATLHQAFVLVTFWSYNSTNHYWKSLRLG